MLLLFTCGAGDCVKYRVVGIDCEQVFIKCLQPLQLHHSLYNFNPDPDHSDKVIRDFHLRLVLSQEKP